MIDQLIKEIGTDRIHNLFESKIGSYRRQVEDFSGFLTQENEKFTELQKLGEAEFPDAEDLIIFSCEYKGELSSRSSKKQQYEIAKKILKTERNDAAIFIFYDETGKFRFSFVRTNYIGVKQDFTTWKRHTYFVDPVKPNKTFRSQLNNKGELFGSIDSILKAFSIDAVTEEFYKEFTPNFTSLYESVVGPSNVSEKQDFALLFIIRIIFIGFVQKRGWLDDNQEFIKAVWEVYKENYYGKNEFYSKWLEPIFFEALNSPPGREVKYGNNTYTEEISKALKMAPYLNGEIFNRKNGIDNQGHFIPDESIDKFIDFLFSYNFTIEENTNYDEELELNPEFLGIIFERLVNKEDGAVYTPRTEVDFMCRISLVKWLQKVSSADTNDLYYLFFTEEGDIEDQKQGDFSSKQIEELISFLKEVSICDPASGSGAFPVGMMHVLNEIIENLQNRHNTPSHLKAEGAFERKKAIIGNSLYGVEVKQWAVWINQLRLWLSLFVDVPEDKESEYRYSPTPLLPNLDFKIRCGDSLVQKIGEKLFPVKGHASFLNSSIKKKITDLKKVKKEFYYNRSGSYHAIKKKENSIYRSIIDEQIDEIKKEIKKFKTPIGDQSKLFETAKQTTLDLDKASIVSYEKQITKLESERLAYKEDHPLIWNIEFAEIFYDKGGFDIIIGNPPYVSQLAIADPYQKVKSTKKYKSLLEESIRAEYPRYFTKKETISGKSDLYTYFYVKSLRLLNQNGIHTFICSNSWLDAGYGIWQQKFLLNYCNNCWIIDNHAKRSFANADVNTIISIIDSPVKNKKELESHSNYKFIAFKKSFEESILTENLLKIENQTDGIIKNEIYRSFPNSINFLLNEGSEYKSIAEAKLKQGNFIGDKWGGKYLRAPDIFTTIFKKLEGHESLSQLAKIRRGITTGCNEFFYIKQGTKEEYKLSAKSCIPAILKTNEVKIPDLNAHQSIGYFFSVTDDKIELADKGELDYINYGENQNITIKQGKDKGKTIKGFHNITSVASRRNWYSLGDRNIPPLLWIIAHNDRSIAFRNHSFLFGDNFFEIYPKEEINTDSIYACLNSTYITLFRELYGRANFGGGVLKTQKPDISKFPILLDIDYTGELYNRESKSIFEEVGINPKLGIPISEQEPKPLPDRKKLDDLIFDKIGLNEEERISVYRSVCQLVWNRLNKAKSV